VQEWWFNAAMQHHMFGSDRNGDNTMAIRAEKTNDEPVKLAAALPDWVAAYFTPSEPANRVEPPHQSALDQMYAYYEA
jgi:hypothetical protein